MREEPMPEIIAEPQVRGVSSGRRVLVVGAAGNLGRRMVASALMREPCRDGVRAEPKVARRALARAASRVVANRRRRRPRPGRPGRALRDQDGVVSCAGNAFDGEGFVRVFDAVTTAAEEALRATEVGSGRWPASQRWRSRAPAGAGSTFRACRAPTCPMARTSAVSSARPSRGPWSARDPWFRRRKRGSAGSCARRSTWFRSQRRPGSVGARRRAGPVPDDENPDSDGELRGRRALRRGPSVGRRLCRPPCGSRASSGRTRVERGVAAGPTAGGRIGLAGLAWPLHIATGGCDCRWDRSLHGSVRVSRAYVGVPAVGALRAPQMRGGGDHVLATDIVWLRDDFRLDDQPALAAASDGPALCVYVHDQRPQNGRPLGGAAKWRLAQSLASLERDLAGLGGRLDVVAGDASRTILALARPPVRAACCGAGATSGTRSRSTPAPRRP